LLLLRHWKEGEEVKILAAIALAVGLTACGGGYVPEDETVVNTNPQEGWVEIWEQGSDVWKRCDGSTLLYYAIGGGLSDSPNSTECAN
jgi:hypothetical protein